MTQASITMNRQLARTTLDCSAAILVCAALLGSDAPTQLLLLLAAALIAVRYLI
jgi:hypothetical protein